MGGHGLHSSGLVPGQLVSYCEHVNESADSIKCQKFN